MEPSLQLRVNLTHVKQLFPSSYPTAVLVIRKLFLGSTFMPHDSFIGSMMMLPCGGCTNTVYGLRWLIRPRRPDYCGALDASCHQDLTWSSPASVDQLMTDHCVWSQACPRHTYLACPQVQLPYLESLRADYLFLTAKKYPRKIILSL